jgi:hypothetical protein
LLEIKLGRQKLPFFLFPFVSQWSVSSELKPFQIIVSQSPHICLFFYVTSLDIQLNGERTSIFIRHLTMSGTKPSNFQMLYLNSQEISPLRDDKIMTQNG